MKLSSFQFIAGLTGRGENPPPQLGQTFPNSSFTQDRQKVHSKEQIIASVDAGGRDLLQCSQTGRNSSI